MSKTSDDFNRAAEDVKQLSQKPGTDTLLKLYALYKQGQVGDVEGKRPGMMDLKGRAKYDAWAALKGTSPKDAMQEYISLVKGLKKSDGS